MANRILKRPEVERLTGMSASSIYAKMRAGTFPAARRLGPGSVGWLESDLDAWMEALPAADPADTVQPRPRRVRPPLRTV